MQFVFDLFRPAKSIDSFNNSMVSMVSLDEAQIIGELESKGSEMIREWSTLLKSQQQQRQHGHSRESITWVNIY